MSKIKSVLQDELKRLTSLLQIYERQIQELPKGSLSPKKRNNNIYYYLAFRSNQKVVFKYIGKKDDEKTLKAKEEISKRKEIEKKIKSVKNDIKEITKVLGGRKI